MNITPINAHLDREKSYLISSKNPLLENREQAPFCTREKCKKIGLCLLGTACCALGNTLIGMTISKGINVAGAAFDVLGACFFKEAKKVADFGNRDELEKYRTLCLETPPQILFVHGVEPLFKEPLNFSEILNLRLLSRQEWREKYLKLLNEDLEISTQIADSIFELGILTSQEHDWIRNLESIRDPEAIQPLLENLNRSLRP